MVCLKRGGLVTDEIKNREVSLNYHLHLQKGVKHSDTILQDKLLKSKDLHFVVDNGKRR